MKITPPMLCIGLILGALSAYLAYKRNRNPYLWFVLGTLFGLMGIFAIFFAPPGKKTPENTPPEPIFTIKGPTHKFWYYLNPANEQQGPISHNALMKAWKEGKIELSTYVWHEDIPNWTPLKEILITED